MISLFRARQRSTGRWFQRLDTGSRDPGALRAEVARGFSVDPEDVEVVVTALDPSGRATEDPEYQRIKAELASGTHDGATVIPALPGPLKPPSPHAALKTKIDAALEDRAVPQTVREVLAELRASFR